MIRRTGAVSDLEALTIWLAERAGQQYIRIDPLKIDATLVTRVMSCEFARKHQILALAVKDDEVIIVSAQPYVHGWEATIEQSLPGRALTRVLPIPSTSDVVPASFIPWPFGQQSKCRRYSKQPTEQPGADA